MRVNNSALIRYIKYGWLPIPESIIPPLRPFYLWSELPKPRNFETIFNVYRSPILNHIYEAILRCVESLHSKKVGVWFSGGIDSSILLFLLKEILGSNNVTAYSLNFGYQEEVERAKLMADFCNVKLIIKEFTLDDHLNLIEEAIINQRSPITCSTQVLYISKICRDTDTINVFEALGLDELQAGYIEHVKARPEDFHKVEEKILWRCQSKDVWIDLAQSEKYVNLMFPFLDSRLISFCRSLPRSYKCSGYETKIRLRYELKDILPKEIIEAGRIAGTKKGFIPPINEWLKQGLNEWCNDMLKRLLLKYKVRLLRDMRDTWRKLRATTVPIFLKLIEDGKLK